MITCPTPDKVSYWTRRLAKSDANSKGRKLRAYKCVCGSWHLTSQPRRPRTSA